LLVYKRFKLLFAGSNLAAIIYICRINRLGMKYIVLLLIFLVPICANSQSSALLLEKPKNNYVLAQIFTEFRYGFKDSFKPQAAFNFNQGIIGYVHQLSKNVKGTILYDVTRTTHFYDIVDTSGNHLDYSYFEGSKYTAYLKMAEIKWDITDFLTLRVGQLLNTQYLTFQDRFWGYRYVDVTFQEKFRLGMPADFGAQVDLKYKDKLVNQISVVNGEGPFRYQDINSKFIYSNNIQYYPTARITLKLYLDYGPASDTGSDAGNKSVISGFVGYKTEKFRIGGEYAYVFNYANRDNVDYSGYSFYAGYSINQFFQVLARYDHLDLKIPDEDQKVDYYILGIQYEPISRFTTSVNYRYFSSDALSLIYTSFGLKF